MIVVCTNCHAKFRVPDEKVGPRGAKVRCSRCTTVFLVRPDGIAATEGAPYAPPGAGSLTQPPRPALDVDLEPAPAAPAAFGMADPFSTGALALSATPSATQATEASAAVLRGAPPPLPGTRPSTVPSTEADPFATWGLEFSPGAAAGSEVPEPGPPPVEPDAPPASGSSADALPLTDLSDLLGPATPLEVPGPYAADSSEGAPSDDGGLSLEERLTPPPVAVGGAGGELFVEPDAVLPGLDAASPALAAAAAGDAFAPSSNAFALSYEGEPLPGEEALAMEGARREPTLSEPEPPPPADIEPVPDARGPATPVERAPRRRLPLRSIAANAVALAALLAIALAMLAVWRSEGPFEIAMLRPSALLAALRTDAPPAPFAAVDLRSGVYERENGPPILFVRGRILSRAAAPVRGVLVAVEVVRDGEVIARGAALAGAVPTAEELWTAPDSSLKSVAQAASARVPAQVRPGDRVPFLVAIGDHPGDLEGATLRLALSPAEGKAP